MYKKIMMKNLIQLLFIYLINFHSFVNTIKFSKLIDEMKSNEFQDGIYRTFTIEQYKTSENFETVCYAKLNKLEICRQFSSNCPRLQLDWTFPSALLMAGNSRRSLPPLRVEIITNIPQTVPSLPDIEFHLSKLKITNLGLIHNGMYECNFKLINQRNSAIEQFLTKKFNIYVEGGLAEDECAFDDQCESNNCFKNKCVCDETTPVYISNQNKCLTVVNIGKPCLFNQQCQSLGNAKSICVCSASNANVTCEVRTCQCLHGYVAVARPFGVVQCLPPAILGEKCETNEQCQTADAKTHCSFNNICICDSGHTCRAPKQRRCAFDSDCYPEEFCEQRNVCRKKALFNDHCDGDYECKIGDRNSHCQQSKCVCIDGHKYSPTKDVCIKRSECDDDEDCYAYGAYCDQTICRDGKQLNEHCEHSNQCLANNLYSYCDERQRCSCLPGYKLIITNVQQQQKQICHVNNFCKVNADCKLNANGVCSNNVCRYRSDLNARCLTSADCLLATAYSYCDQFKRVCRCGEWFEQAGHNLCKPIACNVTAQCNWRCVNGACGCENGKEFNKYGECILIEQKHVKHVNWTLYIMIAGSIFFAGVFLVGIVIFVIGLITRERLYTVN